MLDFLTIDSETKAYLLGLFGADGSITKETQINIGLSGEDKDFVYLIKEMLGATQKVSEINDLGLMEDPRSGKIYTRSPKCTIQITDKNLAQQFISHGVIPRKSLILEPPKELPAGLQSHYIRGYFDGDGTVTFDGKKPDTCIYSASKKILEFINQCFLSTYSHSVGVSKNRNIWRLHYGYRTGYEFLNFIYKDATVRLPRKYNKYVEIKNYYSSLEWTEEELDILIKHHKTLSYTGLQSLLSRWGKDSIMSKIKELNLQRPKSVGIWLEEELEALRILFPLSLKERVMEAIPNRTHKAIQGKAAELGIKRKHNIGRKRHDNRYT
jgi:hypothetical protein